LARGDGGGPDLGDGRACPGFAAPVFISLQGPAGFDVKVLDTDCDGWLDIAIPQTPGISVLRNAGEGRFAAPYTVVVGNAQYQPDALFRIGSADFNEDGWPDLVASSGDPSTGSGGLWLLLNGGGQGFAEAGLFRTAGPDAVEFSLADYNGDGHVDAIFAEFNPNPGQSSPLFPCGNNNLALLLGDGLGDLRDGDQVCKPNFDTPAPALGDFNGDGLIDVVARSVGSQDPLVLLENPGTARFGPPQVLDPTDSPNWLVSADLNRDGYADLLTAIGSMGLSVRLGNGDGSFSPPSIYNVGIQPSPGGFVVVDLNGDGSLDAVVADYRNDGSGGLAYLLGNGDGTFQAAQECPLGGNMSPAVVAAGDMDGDGRLDLVASAYPPSGSGNPAVAVLFAR
jgi:hypothetical protein